VSTRLDLALQKYPGHEEGIRQLAALDPSGNLKYLDWGAKMLASGQALAPEIADVIELFHRFAGRRFGGRGHRHARKGDWIHPDIYTYRPQDLAKLRDNLFKMQRAQDRKRRQREKLYRIEGAVEVDVVYDSPDLIVRHIKNKQASVHYGLGTKWCISMLREGHFEEYESHNATFFFFERKVPLGDEFDKVALMVPRNGDGDRGWRVESGTAFTSVDEQVDMMVLARVHGTRVFDIFRQVFECSDKYPGSGMFQVGQGRATAEQLTAAYESAVKGDMGWYETESILEAICCNDAAPQALLEEILRRGPSLVMAASKRRGRRYRRHRGRDVNMVTRTLMAALVIHPQIPTETREKLTKDLGRRRIKVSDIHRTMASGRIGIVYQPTGRHGMKISYRRHARKLSLSRLQARVRMFQNMVKRARKQLKKKQAAKKLADKKRQKRAARKSR
jgi:hypothetical protein